MFRTVRVLAAVMLSCLGLAAAATPASAQDWGCTSIPLTATLAGLTLPLDVLRSNPPATPCATDDRDILDIDLAAIAGISANTLDSSTTTSGGVVPDRTVAADATVADLGLELSGFANLLSVGTASSSVTASCPSYGTGVPPTLTAQSNFTDVQVLGVPITILNTPVDLNVGLVRVQITPHFEQRTATSLRRVALHVELSTVLLGTLLTADIADSQVSATDDPCGAATSGAAPALTVAVGPTNRTVVAQATPASALAHDALQTCTMTARRAGTTDAFVAVETTFDAETGACTGTLDPADFPGAGDFEVVTTVVDADGDEATDTSTIAVVAPAAGAPTADGRDLDATLSPAPGVALAGCQFTLTPAAGGTAVIVPGTIEDGACVATAPASVPDGEYDVTVSVTDVNGDSGQAVSADPLLLSGTAPTVTLDPGAPNRELSATAVAPAGETLASCTIEVRPAGGTTYTTVASNLDPATGACTAELPLADFPPGDYETLVTVTDSSGDSAQTTGAFTIAAPEVGAPVAAGRELSVPVTPAPGVELTACEFTLTPAGGGTPITLPGTLAAGACTATAPGTVPDGAYDVHVEVTDANGDTGEGDSAAPVSLSGSAPSVTLDPDAPNRTIAASATPPTGEALTACTIQVRPVGGTYETVSSTFDPATGACTAQLPLEDFAPGDYETLVTVTDASGDSAQTAGAFTIATPDVGASTADERELSVPVTPAPGTTLTACEFTLTPAGGGAPVTVPGTLAGGACTATAPGTLPDGPYDVHVAVTDDNGDVGEADAAVLLSGTAPTVTFAAGTPNRELAATGVAPAGETLTSCTLELRPAGGTTYTPVAATLDPATGACTARLPRGSFAPGDYETRVTVTDGSGDSAETTGTLTIATPSLGEPVAGGRALSVPVTPAPGVAVTVCEFTLTPAGGGAPVNVQGTIAGGVCTATAPATVPDGAYDVHVAVADANGDPAEADSADAVTLSGNAPVVTLDPDAPNRTIAASATPPAGETLTACTIQVRPVGGTYEDVPAVFDPEAGACTARLPLEDFPPGDYETLVTVTDSSGDSSETAGAFTIATPAIGGVELEDESIVVPVSPAPGTAITSCTVVLTPAGGEPVDLRATWDAVMQRCVANPPAALTPGEYTVSTVVTDDNGDSSTSTQRLVVPLSSGEDPGDGDDSPDGGGEQPGGGGGGGPGGGGDAPNTQGSPPGSTPGDPFTEGTVGELALACGNRKLVLTDVQRTAGRVRLRGFAAAELRGKRVQITFAATRKVVARPTVAADGTFSARVARPPARIARTNAARYVASVGSERSLALKLNRRMAATMLRASGGSVTFSGRIEPPIARTREMVTLKRQVACGRYETVGRARLSATGRYRIRVQAPSGVRAAVYRADVRVASRPGGPARARSFTLPLPIDLT